jgi:hypothetical protein
MNEMAIEQQHKEATAYFCHVIKGYLANDIKTLLTPSYELDKREYGGCAAPLALSTISGIEQLGFLTSQKETDDIEKRENTELLIKEFCNDWMSKVDKIYKKSTFQEIIVRFFRHGMAHQFMPIHNMAISRHPIYDRLLYVRERNGEKFFILQVAILAKHFLDSLDHLEGKLKHAIKTDPAFISRFFRRLAAQRTKYYEKNLDLIAKAEKNLQIESDSGSKRTTTTSGTNTSIVNGDTTITV